MTDGVRWAGTILLVLMGLLVAAPARAQDVITEWAHVTPPPAPEVKAVTVDAKTTALLILDIQRQICNERLPRCLTTVPKIQRLLARARAKQVPVLYSLAGEATPTDILKEVAPQGAEPVVKSGPDKFLGTDLEVLLQRQGVRTVIVVGCKAHGAVLYTASSAALRGFAVVVPVDGMSADTAYPEQYVAWHLVNAPRVSTQTTLTRTERIEIR